MKKKVVLPYFSPDDERLVLSYIRGHIFCELKEIYMELGGRLTHDQIRAILIKLQEERIVQAKKIPPATWKYYPV